MGMLLTLSSVRARTHSYHSQADSAGSIPVTRATGQNRCHISQSSTTPTLGQLRILSIAVIGQPVGVRSVRPEGVNERLSEASNTVFEGQERQR